MRQSSYKGFGYVLDETVAPRNIGRLRAKTLDDARQFELFIRTLR